MSYKTNPYQAHCLIYFLLQFPVVATIIAYCSCFSSQYEEEKLCHTMVFNYSINFPLQFTTPCATIRFYQHQRKAVSYYGV
jgi:hypothetical protein